MVSHDYYVVATGGTTFFGNVQEALAFAHTQNDAVLYVNTAADENSYFEGVETHFIVGPTTKKMRYGAVDARVSTLQPATTKLVLEAGQYDSVWGGGYNPVSGAVNPDYTADSFEIVMNGGTVANLYAGGRTSGTKFKAAEVATVTVNGGRVTGNFGAVSQNGAVGEAIINVNGGLLKDFAAFTAANTAITDDGLTINFAGGTVANLFYAGGGSKLEGLEINGGVRLNVTGGLLTGRVSSGVNGTNSTTTTVTGGMYLNFTGGTLVKDIYGSGDGFGSVTGGVHILIDGLESKVKCYGAYRMLADTIEITMKSGAMTSICAGANELDMTVDSVINLEGGSVDYLFGTSGKFFTTTGTSDIVMSGGVVTTLLSLNGGTKTGAILVGDATLTVSGGTIAATLTANGGSALSGTYTGKITGDATITVTDGLITGDYTAVTYGQVDGNVTVNLLGGTFGGSFDGTSSLVTGASTLNIGAAIATTGNVANFGNISIAAGASLTAAAITASAITADATGYGAGSYTLATGFAAQDSTITVVNGSGVELGTVLLSASATSGSFTVDDLTYTVAVEENALKLDIATTPVPPATVAEFIVTCTDSSLAYVGATGTWKVQTAEQTASWQDVSTIGAGDEILGLGLTVAGKAMPDVYYYNADAKFVGAYVTDATGAVTGFESVFVGELPMMQVGLGDFNADGASDLLLRTTDGFLGYYANGAFNEFLGLGTEWTVAGIADIDGNGRDDVIIAHEVGFVGAYLVGNDGSITWSGLGVLDSDTQIAGTGDINGDGIDDVVVKVGENYFGAWICNEGTVAGFSGIGEFNAELQNIADYNADGKADLLFRLSDGTVGAALVTDVDATTWNEYGTLDAAWAIKGKGLL